MSDTAHQSLLFKKHIARRAFRHKDKWPLYLGNQLALVEVLKDAGRARDEEELAAVLSSAGDGASNRRGNCPSPLVVYEQTDPHRLVVSELWTMLFVEDVRYRKAASRELELLITQFGSDIRASGPVKAALESVTSDNVTHWRASAELLRKLIGSSFRMSLAGMADRLNMPGAEIDADEAFTVFGCSDALRNVAADVEAQLPKVHDQKAKTTSLMEALGWRAPTVGRTIGAQRRDIPPRSVAWLIDNLDGRDTSWDELCELASAFSKEPRGTGSRARFVYELSKHYVHSLESGLPALSQLVIAESALLLATYVEWVLQCRAPDISHDMQDVLGSAPESYLLFWRYARAPKFDSALYGDLMSGKPNVLLPLLRAIDRRNSNVENSVVTEQQAKELSTFIVFAIARLVCTPAVGNQTDGEEELGILQRWFQKHGGDDVRQLVEHIKEYRRERLNNEALVAGYLSVDQAEANERSVALSNVDTAVRCGLLDRGAMLEKWSDAEWRKRIFSQLGEGDLDTMLCDCMSWFELRPTDESVKWTHQLVDTALSFEVSSKQFELATAYVAIVCLRTNVMSALDRLAAVTGGSQSLVKVREATTFVRLQADSAPPWLAGRMRSVCASLGI